MRSRGLGDVYRGQAHGFMPEWGNFADDSGGECGVPMSKNFRMPSSAKSNGVYWYSYNHASIHTTVISSDLPLYTSDAADDHTRVGVRSAVVVDT